MHPFAALIAAAALAQTPAGKPASAADTKKRFDAVESRVEQLSSTNKRLEAEVAELRQEVAKLKAQAEAHGKTLDQVSQMAMQAVAQPELRPVEVKQGQPKELMRLPAR